MKTSRRQQLRTNQLAQSLTELIEFVKANSSTVLAGVATVVVVVGLGVYWYSARTSRRWAEAASQPPRGNRHPGPPLRRAA